MTIICPLPQCGQHWMSMPVKRSMICWRVFNNRHGHHCLDSHQRPDQGDVAVFVTVKDTVQALGSMARESADVTVVVCANHSYRILETELARAGIALTSPKALALTDLTCPVIAGLVWRRDLACQLGGWAPTVNSPVRSDDRLPRAVPA